MHVIRSLPKTEDFTFSRWTKAQRRFPVRGRPRRLKIGDTIFFSHRGKIAGRSILEDIHLVDEDDDMSYLEQGAPQNRDLYYYLCVGPIKAIRGGPPFVGRVGIRYIDKLRDKSLKSRLSELVL